MTDKEQIIQHSAAEKVDQLNDVINEKKTLVEYFAVAVATCGVGFIPIAPGTFGSAVGVTFFIFVRLIESDFTLKFAQSNYRQPNISAWLFVFNLILFLLICGLAIWSATRAVKIFRAKDPQKVVIDEVIGQFAVFLFVPLNVSAIFIFAGFILFRLFDVWKPYPIRHLEKLPTGFGVCADDILAGIYGGISLAIIYAVSLSF